MHKGIKLLVWISTSGSLLTKGLKTHATITAAAAFVLASLLCSQADAVGTRRFVLDSLKSFEGGDLKGVAISSDGEVRAGLTLSKVEIPDASNVWSSVVLPDGSVLLGTGADGRIYRVKNGKVSIAVETGAMAVSAMVIGFSGDVIAGTFPDGKLFRFSTNHQGKLKSWVTLKDTEDIWALAFDAKKQALFAATGPNGKLYRIGRQGKAEVLFDSEEAHLVSLAIGPNSAIYAGSSGKALLYRIAGPGRATVMHDFEGTDVKAIATAADGTIYAVSNTYKGSTTGLRTKSSRSKLKGAAKTPKTPKPGKGELMRFGPTGVAELMLKDDTTHFTSLSLDDQGTPFVGTGAEGRVYSVSRNHVRRLVVDTDERQVGALAIGGRKPFVATTDPVVFHRITGRGGRDAVWTSKELDAGLRAHFGLLEWHGDGALEFQTRSGNTSEADDSWSPWSGPITKAQKIKSPAARYLQIRANWGRDPKAVLRQVKAAFVTDNARALISSIEAGDDAGHTSSSTIPTSGAAPKKPDGKLKLSWKVENPDNDKLRYRLLYRSEKNRGWFSILPSDHELTATTYSWDTDGLPEGRYRVRVDVSDELSNPPGRVQRHNLQSRVLLIDNTAPRFIKLDLTANRLQGTAVDGLGPLSRIEFALVGTKSWFPVFPKDQVFDQKRETFDVDVSVQVPTGPQMVVVRAYDSAGNRVTQTVTRGR